MSRVTIYSLDILLFLFGTSLLFHVQFFLTCIRTPTAGSLQSWDRRVRPRLV